MEEDTFAVYEGEDGEEKKRRCREDKINKMTNCNYLLTKTE
jgi:hypothetical protein